MIPIVLTSAVASLTLMPLLPINNQAEQAPIATPVASTPAPVQELSKLLVVEDPLVTYKNARKLTANQLSEILYAVGFTGSSHKIAWALAMRESRGNPLSHRVVTATADNSYGLFQINMRGYLGPARAKAYHLKSYDQLLDPVTNAQVAWKMSRHGTDFGPWGIGIHAYRSNRGLSTISEYFAQYPGIQEPKLVPAKVELTKYIYVNPGVIHGKQ